MDNDKKNISRIKLNNEDYFIKDIEAREAVAAIATYGDIVTHNVSEFATAEQGGKANTAIQNIVGGIGLKVTVDVEDETKVTVNLDETVIFVFDGGSASSEW